jgi:hypothetical protein
MEAKLPVVSTLRNGVPQPPPFVFRCVTLPKFACQMRPPFVVNPSNRVFDGDVAVYGEKRNKGTSGRHSRCPATGKVNFLSRKALPGPVVPVQMRISWLKAELHTKDVRVLPATGSRRTKFFYEPLGVFGFSFPLIEWGTKFERRRNAERDSAWLIAKERASLPRPGGIDSHRPSGRRGSFRESKDWLHIAKPARGTRNHGALS